MTALELTVQNAQSIAIAERVRPDRIEVAAALGTGGVTPSSALIDAAIDSGVPAHVLVRPREGGFEYDDAEREIIIADAAHAIRLGAAGVVIGGLRGATIDVDLVRRVLDVSEGSDVTFHRAFDMTGDLPAALDALLSIGVTRVLTSGGASSAADALDVLCELSVRSGGAIHVMAGAGITSENAATVAATGVDAIHASAKRMIEETLAVSLSTGTEAGRTTYAVTDEREAAAIQAALARGDCAVTRLCADRGGNWIRTPVSRASRP